MSTLNTDIVVIGAGPSGAVAAAYLNKQGHQVLVLEKQVFPRFVIGESLLPHCMDQLDEVGFLPALTAHGFQKKTGAAFYRDDRRCDFFFSEQFTKGWSWTWQVQRKDFDNILIQEAAKQGVTVEFQAEVTAVNCSANIQTVSYKDKAGVEHTVTAKYVVDASGYGRVLPRLFDLDKPSAFPARGSVFAHVEEPVRSDMANNNIFIHSFNNNKAWMWAIPFSNGTTSVGIVGEKEYVETMAANGGAKYKEFIATTPELKGRFTNNKLVFEPRSILGYSVGVKQMYGEGYVMCGNSTEFLDPVFSSGVTLATSSGMMAAKLVHKQLTGETVDWAVDYEKKMQHGINVFRSYVEAWYNGDLQTIFFADKLEQNIKDQICSVLAGYVWDETNPFVKKHDKLIKTLASVVKMKEHTLA